jgi:hypothetical protein
MTVAAAGVLATVVAGRSSLEARGAPAFVAQIELLSAKRNHRGNRPIRSASTQALVLRRAALLHSVDLVTCRPPMVDTRFGDQQGRDRRS